MGGSLKDILGKILKEYDFETGPLFKLGPKLRLHSALAYKYSNLEKEVYIGKTVERASYIFRALDFQGDLLLVYDNLDKKNSDEEVAFIESKLVNIKSREEYSYKWENTYDEETYYSKRTIYQLEDLEVEELFREISLSDFSGSYDFTSSIFIIDMASKSIFYLYDDRGLYIMAREEKVLQELWESLPTYFFEDCQDFEIKIRKLYWIDGSQDNREDLCLHGDLEIRINNQIIEYSPTVSAAGLRLLRSLFEDHQGGYGDQVFPCCGNTILVNKPASRVDIIGCDQGLDWSIEHDKGLVNIRADEKLQTTIYYLQYKKEVLKFIREIEDFYKKSGEKNLGEDKAERMAYLAFWEEWKSLRDRSAW